MSQPFIGEIRLVGFDFAPVGWASCDGTLLSISQNEVLFQLIGTTYGGDGQNTFALPDLRGRLPVHQATTGFTIGQNSGAESVTLTTSQLPAHAHTANALAGPGSSGSPSGNFWAATSGPAAYVNGNPTPTPMDSAALQSAGGNQPHENMPPFQVVNFIIAVEGIFPSQT